ESTEGVAMSGSESTEGAAMSDSGEGVGVDPADQVTPSDLEDLSQSVADQTESFLIAVREIAAGGDVGRGVPFLLLEVSQLLLAGARLGAQVDFVPTETYEPDP